jgi:branched-chain amino acid transport system substrate-binding protein
MRVRGTTATFGIFAAVAMALFGCSGTTTSSSGGAGTITLAAVGPFSGDNATFGIAQLNGINLALKEINANGGIDGKTVVVEKFDDKCDPTEAANVASRIVSSDTYYAVLGHLCSSATLAALPIYKRSGISVISGSSTNPSITKLGYTNFSRNISTDDIQGAQIIDFAKSLGKSRIGIVYASDDYGQGLYDTAVKEAKTAGVQIVAAETFTPTTTKDYTSSLTKIGAANPDVLLLFGYYNDMGTLVSQIGRTSLAGVQLVGAAGTAQPDYAKLGGSATEDTYLLSYYDPASPLPANQTYVKDYQQAYPGQTPNEQAAYWYEIPFILKAAVENNGSSKANLTDAIHKVVYEGPTGTTKFDTVGDVLGKVGIVSRVKDQSIVIDPDLTKKFASQ